MGAFEILLFVIFAVLASVGLFLIGNHFHSRRLGVILGLASLSFFVLLFCALAWMISTYGP
jgi:hypothetical protein